MCGIAGYAGDDRPELLERMAQTMAHRGPDDAGTWHDPAARVGLAHRRLSIIDLSPAGHQPMSNEDGSLWITYNGELYDFADHRKWLLARGHHFRSQSDTEVLLHLYEELGDDFLAELNGIFAFAIWDGRRRRMLLARDHAGIKPLYYWQGAQRLYFASEIKALLQVDGIPRELDRESIPHYLTFLWVPGERTLLRGINKLEPGHALTWHGDGRSETRRWFELDYQPDESVGDGEWAERVRDTFMRTTRRQMVSDVPLGAYLSGGVDSSSIVACMRSSFPERRIKCYTVRFDAEDMAREQFADDYGYAERVARHLDVDLESFTMRSDAVRLLPKMVYHLDEPDADPAVLPSYWISKLARDDGTTVLLSGTGGDEIFFGYRSHQAYRLYEWLSGLRGIAGPALRLGDAVATGLLGAQSAIARRMRKFGRGLSLSGIERHMSMADCSSEEARRAIYSPAFADSLAGVDPMPECMTRYFESFRGTGEINRHSHLLIQTFLSAHNFNYTDKSSMATSIEVRVPFMDVELMRLAATIPENAQLRGGVSKRVLKSAMAPHLPHDVLHRPKQGFGAPLRKWIAEDLDDLIREALGESHLDERGLFDARAVSNVLAENRENRADHAYLIYALLTLELWMQTFLDRPGVEVA